MSYAVVDVDRGTMTYARAGHTPLLHLPAGPDATSQAHVADGMVLGLKFDNGELFERVLEERTVPLTPGDWWVFYTDGVSEAMNADEDCYGETRLGLALEAGRDRSCDAVRDLVLGDIGTFVAGAPQHDDMTMVLLRVDDV